MLPGQLVSELKMSKEFFDRGTAWLTEAEAGFTPAAGMFTAAAQIAHVAQVIEWFHAGAFGKGFDMNFPEMEKEVRKVKSVAEARAWLDRAFAQMIGTVGSKAAEELAAKLPPGPILGGQPVGAIVGALADHNAHHRGALTVYARLCGKTAAMPYM